MIFASCGDDESLIIGTSQELFDGRGRYRRVMRRLAFSSGVSGKTKSEQRNKVEQK